MTMTLRTMVSSAAAIIGTSQGLGPAESKVSAGEKKIVRRPRKGRARRAAGRSSGCTWGDIRHVTLTNGRGRCQLADKPYRAQCGQDLHGCCAAIQGVEVN